MSSLMFLSFSCCLYTLFVLFSPLTTTLVDASTGNLSDHEALLQFKSKIIDDPLGVLSSWNHTTHFCQWHGVNCSKRHHQRVTVLNLSSLKLSGSISPYIGNLSFLNVLQLKNNGFNNQIPPQIGRLHSLQVLSLWNNSVSGNIPVNLSSCSDLVSLDLRNNQLEGQIHGEFGSLVNLQFVKMGKNHLTGNIPSSLGNLSSLQVLHLTENNLHGSIPHTLGQLRNLFGLGTAANKLSGVIPPSVLNMSSLIDFDVGSNQLHGTLPSNLGSMLPNLQWFSVIENQFTGLFPTSLANVSTLAVLELATNKFSGKVPSLGQLHGLRTLYLYGNRFGGRREENDLNFICTLVNATWLEVLDLGINNFGGMLPECIGNLSTNIDGLTLDNNFIAGNIPTGMDSLTSLTWLSIWNNQFSGTIPANIGRLQNLVYLDLSSNQLQGHIPSSFGNLKQMEHLHLQENNLQGSIPSSIGNCQNLLYLNLSHNSLSGSIPSEIFKISSLSIGLDLSKNHLTGPLPEEIENLKNAGEFDVSDNMLSGKIPISLGSCTSLETLYLQRNHFQGMIPSSLSSLRGLQILDLSQNNFSGKLQEFLADFRILINLNLSYNNFEGAVPTSGVFRNATGTSIIGNSKLCGGVPEFHLPKCTTHNHQRRIAVIISVVCGLFGVILTVTLLLVLWIKNKRREVTTHKDIEEVSMLRVSYNDLLKATDGFSSTNLIGKGSFGSVYEGVIAEPNTVVAIKVLSLSHKGAYKSFMTECEALRKIRHRNLVKVMTACSSTDNQGNDFKALVYDFMVNGSLEDWLHPPVGNGTSSRALSFGQRVDIAFDVACALEYLHQHCETEIVHCDLKPSNVLLDTDMVGHVGDFGLAKFLTEGTTNQSSSIGVRGTIGYAPPEYGLGSKVSTQGDVYSFGILLLEMFTGKRPTYCSLSEDGLSLREYVLSALPNKVSQIADPILLLQGDKNCHNNQVFGMEQTLDLLMLILKIGISCSVEIPKERIPISQVVAELSSIRNKVPFNIK